MLQPPASVDIIAYHGDCPDGFCAAVLAKRAYPAATLVPVTHGQPLKLTEWADKSVLVLDFSWKRPGVEALAAAAGALTILDHHKTAEAELAGLPYCLFDMTRSGAAITWDFFWPDTPRPWYVDYVQDRDLWHWALPASKEINAYIMALPHTLDAWKVLDTQRPADAHVLGIGCRMQIDHYVEKVAAQAQAGTFHGHPCRIFNAAYPNVFDVQQALVAKPGVAVGVGWFERGDGLMQFSLCSTSVDVGALAVKHGGGGHKAAAGFQLPVPEGRAVVDEMLSRKLRE